MPWSPVRSRSGGSYATRPKMYRAPIWLDCLARRCAIGSGTGRHGGARRVRLGADSNAARRQPHREAAALTGRAVDQELRLVAQEHVLDDGESQTGAAGRARATAVDAVEALGQARNMFGGDADA